MPKKKKKSRGSGGSGGGTTTEQPSASSSISARPKQRLDHLCLQIANRSSVTNGTNSNAGKTLRYSPQVIIDERDAEDLDAASGDSVFLVCATNDAKSQNPQDTSMVILGTAIATVRIAKSTQSVPSPTKSSTSSKLTNGYCQIFPPSLANHCVDNLTQKQQQRSTQLKQPSTPPPTDKISYSSTPSSSKSKFSFKSGGGGDLLISPKSTKIPSTPGSTKREVTSRSSPLPDHQLWVIPFNSHAGIRISKRLCHDAINIRILDSSKRLKTGETHRTTLGQRVFLAHTEGSYVSINLKINLSFQGQSLECNILEVQQHSKDDSVAELTNDFTQLDIYENDYGYEKLDDRTGLAQLVHTLQIMDESQLRQLQLFKINHQTVVVFQETTEHTVEMPTKVESGLDFPMLVGLESTLKDIKSLLHTPLFRPSLFQGSLRPPRGVLLHGPSGAGKSSLAKWLARDLQLESVHVEHINCATLHAMTSVVGQAERRLSQIFQSAESFRDGKSGSLVVLDDVHLICPRRGRANTTGIDRLASTLLALLDGISSNVNEAGSSKSNGASPKIPVVILAVTSNPSLLDPALRRPGRLDAEVEVPLPDEPSVRAKILQRQLAAFGGVAPTGIASEEWLSLARLAKGFTGADCTLAMKAALQLALLGTSPSRSDGIPVGFGDLERAIRSTKPSAIKSVTVEIPQVHWSSIGGMEEVKHQLREAIEFPLTHAQMFLDLNLPPPKGVLLYGPPGCSKTLMARALATEGQMNFLAVKGPELLSKWLGESERALASLFKRARLASPSVIFFDEIDAIASKRGSSSSSGGGERLLSQLLTELDGVQNDNAPSTSKKLLQRVVVVGATNRPDLLDSALMRPGRMDRLIYVGIPDEGSRANIFRLGLKGKSCSDDIDIRQLARDDVSHGLSGAEVIAACRNAALMALEEDDAFPGESQDGPIIRMQHLLRSIEGMERQITTDMLKFYDSYRINVSR